MSINDYIKDYQEVASRLNDPALSQALSRAIDVIHQAFLSKKKLLIAGNGGSAADSQHFAAEFMGRFKKERPPYPAIALSTDTSFLTAWSNDYDFKTVFSRQLEALGNEGDVFVCFSTSGNS
ncbi:MAG: SIS domain-containing protein, partial [Anaplasmataceae bacterium]|nr:SIS domain-containing protein [Anaplasmataceae bacterium]